LIHRHRHVNQRIPPGPPFLDSKVNTGGTRSAKKTSYRFVRGIRHHNQLASAETLTDIFQGLPPDIDTESGPQKDAESIQPPSQNKQGEAHSAGGLAALSFFLPGVGQMVCGQSANPC
jgi:hypothetical protein